MIDSIYYLFYNLTVVIYEYIIFMFFFEKKHTGIKRIACLVLWYVLINVISNVLSDYLMVRTLLIITVGTVFFYYLFEVKILFSLLSFFFSYVIGFMSDTIVLLLAIAVLKLDIQNIGSTGQGVFFGTLSLAVQLLVIVIFQTLLSKKQNKSVNAKFYYRIAIIMFFSIISNMYILTSYSPDMSDKTVSSFLILGLGMVLICAINFVVIYDIYINEIIARDRIIEKEKNEKYYHNYIQILEKYEIQKKNQHEVKNRISVISSLAEERRWDELMNYLSEYRKEIATDTVMTGNAVIDSIINSKYVEMVENNIRFEPQISKLGNLPVSDIDITTILANLLNNAIEACKKVEEAGRYIMLSIEILNECINISVVNSYNGTIREKNGILLSTKEDAQHHGIGIANIIDAVEKNNGVYDVSYTDTVFKFMISI